MPGRHEYVPHVRNSSAQLAHYTQGLGTNWKDVMGECSKATTFELLDNFYDLGGNFIDNANAYQDGQSEEWMGEWLQSTGRRDEMVISTKYTLGYQSHMPKQQSNFGGTGTKSMHLSIDDSLKKLQTDYIDLVGTERESLNVDT
jgi:aryl-alcohol dehydrogenase-like predicted oxidoreductase